MASGEGNLIAASLEDGLRIYGVGSRPESRSRGTGSAESARSGNTAAGIFVQNDTIILGGTTSGAANVIAGNGGAGLVLYDLVADRSRVLGNRFAANGGPGIDLFGDGLTPNTPGTDQNAPVISSVTIRSGILDVSGFARPGTAIAFYVAGEDPSGFGEGFRYLATAVEGSAADHDATTGSYGPIVRGLNVGTDTTNRFRFVLRIPSDVTDGTLITAVADGDTASGPGSGFVSEFAGNDTSDAGQVFGAPLVALDDDATITEGGVLHNPRRIFRP